jgi:hypothetical protein
VILLGHNVDSTKENTKTSIQCRKEVVLEINIGETKYMLLSRHHNTGQNRDIRMTNRSFENVS